MRNIRAVKALRRAISATCAVACSSRSSTSNWPARSTTAAAVWKPFALHSASVASAIVLAIASDKTRCVTRPSCPDTWPDRIAATPIPTKRVPIDIVPPIVPLKLSGSRQPQVSSHHGCSCQQVLHPPRPGAPRRPLFRRQARHFDVRPQSPPEPTLDHNSLADHLVRIQRKQKPREGNRLPVQNEQHSGGIAQDQVRTPESARYTPADYFGRNSNPNVADQRLRAKPRNSAQAVRTGTAQSRTSKGNRPHSIR